MELKKEDFQKELESVKGKMTFKDRMTYLGELYGSDMFKALKEVIKMRVSNCATQSLYAKSLDELKFYQGRAQSLIEIVKLISYAAKWKAANEEKD